MILQNSENNGKMYVILNGFYDVQSLQFNKAARLLQEQGASKAGLPPGVVRTLTEGDYFGEVSPMFDCPRSATVMARNFGNYGEMEQESLQAMMQDYPIVKGFMWENIMTVYDDDLKVFLEQQLGRIEYLKRIAKDETHIITHLGFCMEARLAEAGDHLFQENKVFGADELVIIFDGVIELYTHMDNGTDFTIEHLSKGSIVNPKTFIVMK